MNQAYNWTTELEDEICQAIATSEKGLHSLFKENPHWPVVSTIHKHIFNDKAFADKYARAREAQASYLVEQIIEISDDSSGDINYDNEGNERENREFVSRSKLRVDSRKWVAARLAPKKWGDKLEIDQNVSGSIIFKEEKTYEADDKANQGT